MNLNYQQERTLIISAFRYALGRKTYIVSEIVDIIINNWGTLTEHDRGLICHEIKEAIELDAAGMDMDVREWQKILARFESER